MWLFRRKSLSRNNNEGENKCGSLINLLIGPTESLPQPPKPPQAKLLKEGEQPKNRNF